MLFLLYSKVHVIVIVDIFKINVYLNEIELNWTKF